MAAEDASYAPTPEGAPWAGQADEIGCNFAFGHLVELLPQRLTTNGNLQAETLMAAAGAVAGLAAQISLRADNAAFGRAKLMGLADVTLKDGRKLLYGDGLNEMLFTRDAPFARARLWNMLMAAGLSHGMKESEPPSLEFMFQHVTKSLGGPGEGLPSTPGNQPLMPAMDLLKLVGPLALDCLTGEVSEVCVRNNFRAAEPSWVAITAQAAAVLLLQVSHVLPPAISLAIAVESAIYTSKIQTDKPIETIRQPRAQT